MGKNVERNGIILTPASDAAKVFGYTPDYITKLAREGKIDGEKIGRQWFISSASAEYFFKCLESEKRRRREALRKERRSERKKYVAQNGAGTYMQAATDRPHTQVQVRQPIAPTSPRVVALTQTFAILAIGLAFGASNYFITEERMHASVGLTDVRFFEELAIAVYEFISPREQLVIHEQSNTTSGANFQSRNDEPSATTLADRMATSSARFSRVIVVPEDVSETAARRQLEESFSDEVEIAIDDVNADGGYIVPQFRGGISERYRFFIAPNEPSG